MLRERLQSVAGDAGIAPEMLKVLAGDLVDDGMGNLGSPAVQAELEPMVDAADLVILDNLASLSEFFHDDAIGWKPIEQWLVRLRRRGRAVLIVHHAGRSGTPRGTSRREDLLDTSISLQRPLDYSPTQGARFEVHIEKSRVILGEAAAPFEAQLAIERGKTVWTMTDMDHVKLRRIVELLNAGFSLRDIAEETGLSKSAVHRLKQRLRRGRPD